MVKENEELRLFIININNKLGRPVKNITKKLKTKGSNLTPLITKIEELKRCCKAGSKCCTEREHCCWLKNRLIHLFDTCIYAHYKVYNRDTMTSERLKRKLNKNPDSIFCKVGRWIEKTARRHIRYEYFRKNDMDSEGRSEGELNFSFGHTHVFLSDTLDAIKDTVKYLKKENEILRRKAQEMWNTLSKQNRCGKSAFPRQGAGIPRDVDGRFRMMTEEIKRIRDIKDLFVSETHILMDNHFYNRGEHPRDNRFKKYVDLPDYCNNIEDDVVKIFREIKKRIGNSDSIIDNLLKNTLVIEGFEGKIFSPEKPTKSLGILYPDSLDNEDCYKEVKSRKLKNIKIKFYINSLGMGEQEYYVKLENERNGKTSNHEIIVNIDENGHSYVCSFIPLKEHGLKLKKGDILTVTVMDAENEAINTTTQKFILK